MNVKGLIRVCKGIIGKNKLEFSDSNIPLAYLGELVFPLFVIPSEREINILNNHQYIFEYGLQVEGQLNVDGILVV